MRRTMLTRWDGTPADDYAWSPRGGLAIGATPIAEVDVGNASIAPPMKTTIPKDFVLVPDPRNEAERALLGAVLRGTVALEAVDELIRQPGHREVVAALGRFDLSVERSLGVLIPACRSVGLPPELSGKIVAMGEKFYAIGYLASCFAKAPGEEEVVAIMGRLRAAWQRWA